MVMLLNEDGDIISPEANNARIKKLEETVLRLVASNNANVNTMQGILKWIDGMDAQLPEREGDNDAAN